MNKPTEAQIRRRRRQLAKDPYHRGAIAAVRRERRARIERLKEQELRKLTECLWLLYNGLSFEMAHWLTHSQRKEFCRIFSEFASGKSPCS